MTAQPLPHQTPPVRRSTALSGGSGRVPDTAAHPDGDLPTAHRALCHTITQLTEPQPKTIKRDNGRLEITFLDPPYTQLQNAIKGQTGERSGGRNTLPIWVDAADLLIEIDSTVGAWQPPEKTTPEKLHAIQNRKWRPCDVHSINQIAAIVAAWTLEIGILLDGAHIRHLKAAAHNGYAACPNCDTTTTRRQLAGETIQTPALQLQPDGVTRCANCHTRWDNPLWLARLLGYKTPTGITQ